MHTFYIIKYSYNFETLRETKKKKNQNKRYEIYQKISIKFNDEKKLINNLKCKKGYKFENSGLTISV